MHSKSHQNEVDRPNGGRTSSFQSIQFKKIDFVSTFCNKNCNFVLERLCIAFLHVCVLVSNIFCNMIIIPLIIPSTTTKFILIT